MSGILKPDENGTLSHGSPIVLSASRRTDMVRYFGDVLIQKLQRHPPGQVHTIVIWTKDPAPMLSPGPLRNTLEGYDQIFVHLTVTGMGGGPLEPRVPKPGTVLSRLGDLIEFTGSPQRIRLRFDPIVNLRVQGRPYSNLELFDSVAAPAAGLGIKNFITSWMEPYRKVLNRLGKAGMELMEFDLGAQAGYLLDQARKLGVEITFCCMAGLPSSQCISGEELSRLHPAGLMAPMQKARNQRKLCACSQSLDLGSYALACPSGCIYCYANPSSGGF